MCLLWQEGSCSWLCSHDHKCRHPFLKVNVRWKQFILCFLSHCRNTQIWQNNQNKLNQSNMQTILSQISQPSPALNTVKPAKYTQRVVYTPNLCKGWKTSHAPLPLRLTADPPPSPPSLRKVLSWTSMWEISLVHASTNQHKYVSSTLNEHLPENKHQRFWVIQLFK